MTGQFLSIAVITLLGAMSPGPDFVIVFKNTSLYSRQSGCFTSLGVGAAVLVHAVYCIFGLAIIISESILLFNLIKYIGAFYLIYLGMISFFSKPSGKVFTLDFKIQRATVSKFTSFKQGFFCNLLNPKATLFFLALFTSVIKSEASISLEIVYAVEIFLITTTWFCILTTILSQPYIKNILGKFEKFLSKLLGMFLIGFGTVLVFVSR